MKHNFPFGIGNPVFIGIFFVVVFIFYHFIGFPRREIIFPWLNGFLGTSVEDPDPLGSA
jgi:hypothetical protein